MRYAISGFALPNGLILRSAGISCTAKRTPNGEISLKIRKTSALMRKVQLILLLVVLVFSMLPDTNNTPESVFSSVVIPIGFFLLILRLMPKSRILNYHGAEHKVVVAYINRLPLTMESLKPVPRVTKVCGTMLLLPITLYILLLSIVTFFTQNTLIHLILTISALLLIFHYLLLRGRETTSIKLNSTLPFTKIKVLTFKSNMLYKGFDKAGYFLQKHFTTREPSDEELEVAILCMERLIVELNKKND